MTSKFLRSVLAIAVFSMISAWAQTGSAATAAPSERRQFARSSGDLHSYRRLAPAPKIGTINIEQAVIGSNEGQRDFEALSKKLEPKQNELKAQNDELESSAEATADPGRQAERGCPRHSGQADRDQEEVL